MGRAKKAPALGVGTGHASPSKEMPTGQPYGQRQELTQGLAAAPAAGAAPAVPVAQPEPAQQQGADPLAAATSVAPPPSLNDPSLNPNEPVTAGLASGPGPGPDALNMPNPQQQDVQAWRTYLPTLEYLASLPGSTTTTRNFVRQLRAAMPPSAAV